MDRALGWTPGLSKPAGLSAKTFEYSHDFFHVSYTCYKSLATTSFGIIMRCKNSPGLKTVRTITAHMPFLTQQDERLEFWAKLQNKVETKDQYFWMLKAYPAGQQAIR